MTLGIFFSHHFKNIWLPIKGGTAPSQEQLQELQNFIDSQNNVGNAVAIHCTSGRRRTGTMLASYLISSGSSYDDAIEKILNANPQVELREAQSNFLRELVGE
ncbi:dual specificity protein phosphatase family protein [Nostoc sp. CHAB 5715]|uniref:protein-tyrosine phosphatase family protein n=1 Tax=Nostoc sp. CHAB 5715 TaxID=2780400 RepID=UPI001E44E5DA|nr:dual specificity protein phosphatase family protein [Nostoc sp. CHAB 5715]MCC5626425.1 dual specificity protein phosphatase family protein [Nostoc sp. CHAB 5715]